PGNSEPVPALRPACTCRNRVRRRGLLRAGSAPAPAWRAGGGRFRRCRENQRRASVTIRNESSKKFSTESRSHGEHNYRVSNVIFLCLSAFGGENHALLPASFSFRPTTSIILRC